MSIREKNKSDRVNYLYSVELTFRMGKSQDSGGAGTPECERVFSENRKTAKGSITPIHTTRNTKPQDCGGIPPPGCVRVGLQVGTVQYNTTQQIKNYQKN
jgi:hypothetical protein